MSFAVSHGAGGWQGRMVPRHSEAAPRWLSGPACPFLGTGGLLGQRPLVCSSTRFLRCELPSRNYSACPHPAAFPLCGPQPHHFPYPRWECGRPSLWPALVAPYLYCHMGSWHLFFYKKKALGSKLPAEPLQHPAPKGHPKDQYRPLFWNSALTLSPCSPFSSVVLLGFPAGTSGRLLRGGDL